MKLKVLPQAIQELLLSESLIQSTHKRRRLLNFERRKNIERKKNPTMETPAAAAAADAIRSDSPITPTAAMVKRIERAFFYDPQSMANLASPTSSQAPSRTSKVSIVLGNGNKPLGEAVAALLGLPVHSTVVDQYASGEVSVRILESVLGNDVFIIQPTTGNEVIDINTALWELLLLIRKMKLSNARSVTAVIPFFAYARQDRKTALRVPISAAAVAQMITTMGVTRVVTLDLHSGQIQGFFDNVPVETLEFVHEFAAHIRSQSWFDEEQTVIVSPDAGGVDRAKQLADILGVPRVVTIVKRRIKAGQVECMQTVGDVKGFHCIIVDDMCDTGGTLIKACELLKEMGAVHVTACCTHGILTPPCAERMNKSDALQELVVSDSIPQEEHLLQIPKLKVLTIAPLLAKVIQKLARNESLSTLFQRRASHYPRVKPAGAGTGTSSVPVVQLQ